MSEATESLVKWIKERASEVRPTLEADGDWLPMLFAVNAEGQRAVVPIPTTAFKSGGTKDVLAGVVSLLVKAMKPTVVAILVMQWFKQLSVEEFKKAKRRPLRQQDSISEDPARQEKLAIMVYDRNGEQLHFAPVKRHSHRAPTLGPWEQLPVPLRGESRFAEQIVAAFASNN